MKASAVVCAGIVTIDLAFSVESTLTFGLKNRARSSFLSPGGCALNAARAIAALGGNAALAGVVGDDVLGALLRQELAAAGVDGRYLAEKAGEATARSAVLISPDGERTIINYRSESLYDSGLGEIDLRNAGSVLVDTRWPQGAADLVAAARAASIPAVIDAEAPVAHAAEALKGATHVAFSEQGLADFAGATDANALKHAARSLGAWVCVTRGSDPVLCHDGHSLTEVATFPVQAIDTLGAGDVWHGAFALALAEGRAEGEAVRRANAVAALKTTRTGSDSPLPDQAEVEKFLEESI